MNLMAVIEETLVGLPEVPGLAADVVLKKGKGAVFVLVDNGPADVSVVPAADPVGHADSLELLSGNGGEDVVAEDVAVSFRRAEDGVTRKPVDSVTSGAENVVLVSPVVEVKLRLVPVTRVPVNRDADVVLVRGNGAKVVLVFATLVVTEVDLLVVSMTEVLVVVDTDNTVCALGPAVEVVLFRGVEVLKMAVIVVLGLKIERGNVLRVDTDTGEVELTWLEMVGVAELFSVEFPTDGEAVVSNEMGDEVMGGKLVSIVTLGRLPDEEGLAVRVGPEVTVSEEVLLAEAVSGVDKPAVEFREKEFLSVKLGVAELFKASALVSVVPDSVDDSFGARLVKVGVEVEVEVATKTVVEVLEVGIVVTVQGPSVCWPWWGCLQCGLWCSGRWCHGRWCHGQWCSSLDLCGDLDGL